MGTEIERKFLVTDPSVIDGVPGTGLRQGYLSRAPERSVRVRHAGDRAFVTVKGASVGPTRAEWEWEIPVEDAEGMLAICDGPILEKTRHLVEVAGRSWEVDVFAGPNEGLIMAEVELETADDVVVLPPWVGREVTHDRRFYNAYLATSPISTWADTDWRTAEPEHRAVAEASPA